MLFEGIRGTWAYVSKLSCRCFNNPCELCGKGGPLNLVKLTVPALLALCLTFASKTP